MQFLLVFTIFTIVMLGFILSIKFSRYKQRPEQSSCCGGGHCGVDTDTKTDSTPQVQYVKAVGEHVCCKENQ